jgi:hypothetical protein
MWVAGDGDPAGTIYMCADRTNLLAGKTRVCPHCKSTILDSANVCPACRHHLRFGPQAERRAGKKHSAFRVEGTFRQNLEATACEYSVVVSIRDDRGEIKRHVIDVGAMQPEEQRTFELSVEVSESPPGLSR